MAAPRLLTFFNHTQEVNVRQGIESLSGMEGTGGLVVLCYQKRTGGGERREVTRANVPGWI